MEDIDVIREQCDGFLPGVCWAMVGERLRGGNHAQLEGRVKRHCRTAIPVPASATRHHVLAAYGTRCVYCGSGAAIDLDFLVPACRNGNAGQENLVPACARCRGDRGTKHLEIWFKLRLDLDKSAIYARIGSATWRLRHPGEPLRRAA
jgi:5-methylcytosine-specific restriction endonuclease McrA